MMMMMKYLNFGKKDNFCKFNDISVELSVQLPFDAKYIHTVLA